ncbi:MAG: hypothetical protein FWC89_03135 [Defluviitaleaceae bacterium]|nr:hypothetical protein [Defluviitaleaceae bacterium]
MYEISTDKKTFIIADNKISFNDEIHKVFVFPNVWVVELSNYIYKDGQVWGINMPDQPSDNIYGINSECEIVWNIKEVVASYELGNAQDRHWGLLIKLSDSVFRAVDFWGWGIEVDVNTLKVVRQYMSK